MLNISENKEEEYVVFKEDAFEKNPITLVVPQNYPKSLYVNTTQELPFVMKAFVGGLSIVGLYFVYKMMNTKK
jgi:hypothetical protein